MGSIPLTALTSPSRPSSPRTIVSFNTSEAISPIAAIIPTAIGRSTTTPDFLISAGERLMVIFAGGILVPAFLSATFTRSPASLTSPLIKPTMLKLGSPSLTSTSTCIRYEAIPPTAPEVTELNI